MTEPDLNARLAVVESKIDQVLKGQQELFTNVGHACQAAAVHEQKFADLEGRIKALEDNVVFSKNCQLNNENIKEMMKGLATQTKVLIGLVVGCIGTVVTVTIMHVLK